LGDSRTAFVAAAIFLLSMTEDRSLSEAIWPGMTIAGLHTATRESTDPAFDRWGGDPGMDSGEDQPAGPRRGAIASRGDVS
jgi:hypothetical protein